jgi:hypothetical protein
MIRFQNLEADPDFSLTTQAGTQAQVILIGGIEGKEPRVSIHQRGAGLGNDRFLKASATNGSGNAAVQIDQHPCPGAAVAGSFHTQYGRHGVRQANLASASLK